jgi:hypothetical protein
LEGSAQRSITSWHVAGSTPEGVVVGEASSLVTKGVMRGADGVAKHGADDGNCLNRQANERVLDCLHSFVRTVL